MAETLRSRSHSAGKTGSSEPSVFERMIQNLETKGKGRADCDLVRGRSQGREWIQGGKGDNEIQKNAEWKSFIMGVTKSVHKMFRELFVVPFLCVQTIINAFYNGMGRSVVVCKHVEYSSIPVFESIWGYVLCLFCVMYL